MSETEGDPALSRLIERHLDTPDAPWTPGDISFGQAVLRDLGVYHADNVSAATSVARQLHLSSCWANLPDPWHGWDGTFEDCPQDVLHLDYAQTLLAGLGRSEN